MLRFYKVPIKPLQWGNAPSKVPGKGRIGAVQISQIINANRINKEISALSGSLLRIVNVMEKKN